MERDCCSVVSREDLETIRTMADQMRRREKAARRDLLIRREGVRARLGAAAAAAGKRAVPAEQQQVLNQLVADGTLP